MCADSAIQIRNSEERDEAAAKVEQQSTATYVVSLEPDSPISPADGGTADKGSLDGSQAAGAGKAAGEGSPGGSQAAGGSAQEETPGGSQGAGGSDEEGDRWPQVWAARFDEKEQKNADFAYEHHLPMLGILASSGRSSLSRGLIL